MFIGNRLKELRNKKSITQEELGKTIGLSKQTISTYELGTREPDNDTLLKLADFFAVSLDYLLGRTDNPEGLTEEEEQKHIELDEVLSHKKILFYGEPLSLEEKEAVVNVLKIIKQKDKEKK